MPPPDPELVSQGWMYIGGVLAAIVTGFSAVFTFKKGKATPSEPGHVQIPGALVDSSSVHRLATAVSTMNEKHDERIEVWKTIVRALENLSGHMAKANILTEREEEERERRERDKLREEKEALQRSLNDAQRQIDANKRAART